MTNSHTTAHIPDEAVQAAFEAMNPMKSPSECCLYDVKKGLEAALPYLSAPCAVEVDALTQEIRRVNGKNDLGAGALAELLMPFLSCVVTKPVDVLSASEAVCGLLAWISSRNETVVLGSSHGAAIGAELAAAFCKENNLGYCRDNYHEYLKHPTITAAQPFDVAAVREGDEEKRIDTLRIQAFKTNSNADRQAYFDAASKWFQDRHLRALSPAEPAQDEQWRDIKSAPVSNGSQTFLTYITGHGSSVCYKTPSGHICSNSTGKIIHRATHWMPLPAAPTPEAGK